MSLRESVADNNPNIIDAIEAVERLLGSSNLKDHIGVPDVMVTSKLKTGAEIAPVMKSPKSAPTADGSPMQHVPASVKPIVFVRFDGYEFTQARSLRGNDFFNLVGIAVEVYTPTREQADKLFYRVCVLIRKAFSCPMRSLTFNEFQGEIEGYGFHARGARFTMDLTYGA